MFKFWLVVVIALIVALPSYVHNEELKFVDPFENLDEYQEQHPEMWAAQLECMLQAKLYLEYFSNLTMAEVMAVVKKESRFNPNTKFHEKNVNDYSYGPMQVRLKTARGMGFKGTPKQLQTWKYGMWYGMMYLSIQKSRAEKQVLKKYGTAHKFIIRKRMFSMYNAGNLRMKWIRVRGNWEKTYSNHSYVHACERNFYRYNAQKFIKNFS